MAYLDRLFETNFLEYASYVIKDRAIPDLEDGLKPVQRRILHSLFEMDDGKYNKVANVVGHCMKYHPHGDASIFAALVTLANKELFIDKQGNFGNIFTGDPASAARYIECRLTPLAKEVIFNKEITEHIDSYDGRNKEPVLFPSKVPVILVLGCEGIAVGMSTRILPHNFIELLHAQIALLKGDQLILYPDFPTGGLADVSEYEDGNGKVLVRASLDTKDPKRIVIRQLPYGVTTESLINSIEDAAKKNKIKISGISDFTAEHVEIEVRLARGIHSKETVDALFAFTDCEVSIPVQFMAIYKGKPVVSTVTQALQICTDRLVAILTAELKLEQQKLRDILHAKTLEQIFIENRIYKRIEEQKTIKTVFSAVYRGLEPFKSKIRRDVVDEDIERLLKIPIRRISMYDIEKSQKEMREINKRLKEIKQSLAHITDYTISYLEDIITKYQKEYPRKTEIVSFKKVDVRQAAQRNLRLRYDKNNGYLGYEVNGNSLMEISELDRILVIRESGTYSIGDAPDKLYVGKGMLYAAIIDEAIKADTTYTIVFKDPKTDYPLIKRCKIEKYILNKSYPLIPEKAKILCFTTAEQATIRVSYKPKPRVRILEEQFSISDYGVKGVKAGGVRLANREVKTARLER